MADLSGAMPELKGAMGELKKATDAVQNVLNQLLPKQKQLERERNSYIAARLEAGLGIEDIPPLPDFGSIFSSLASSVGKSQRMA